MMKWFAHYNFENPVMHDPLTVASLIDESIIKTEKLKLDFDLSNRGMPFINQDKNKFINVSISVDKEKFFSLFKKVLSI